MRKYGIDEADARNVSNHLTAQNVPDDMTATVEEFKDEPWAKEFSKSRAQPNQPSTQGQQNEESKAETEALLGDGAGVVPAPGQEVQADVAPPSPQKPIRY